ncbi:hypothetical protein GPECTOR_52g49 [Gonium pectorale]|uniref:Uncharacterized protein n=1 Tax=Gonium pectorale TaxID=33097 RepID=A0A150G709_GONPE|nr:hypothetical protein GPECTOR_52g49 [Gonium pectorale]|eukprot:KXZ45649.1 hypothetical protein GPECTOR_52g49 [Gonium pectorale]
MQRHQEQHTEEQRLAAAAAAAAAVQAGTGRESEAPAPAHPGSWPHNGADGALADRDHEDEGSNEVNSGGGLEAEVDAPWALPAQRAAAHGQPTATGQPRHWQRSAAFSARHLATALHAVSRLVPQPTRLGSAERLELSAFVRALGRGCAGLPPGAFNPADLTMALRALAKLLHCGVSGGNSIGGGAPGSYSAADFVAGGDASVHGDSWSAYEGAQYAGKVARWSGGEWEGAEAEGVEGGGAEASAAAASAGPGRSLGAAARGLHAAWLDEAWLERLLGPTVATHLQDFEPRHTSGVLWALATLGARPRPELLAALCDRAEAQCPPAQLRLQGGAHAAAAPPALTPQGLSLVLWALARLGFEPRRAVLDALVAACRADMEAAAGAANGAGGERGGGAAAACCCSLDVAQRLWALATLGRHPGAEWLELAVRAFLERGAAEQVSGQACSMVMWSLAQLSERCVSAGVGRGAGGGVAVRGPGAGPAQEGAEDAGELLRARAESHSLAGTSGRRDGPSAPNPYPAAARGRPSSGAAAPSAIAREPATTQAQSTLPASAIPVGVAALRPDLVVPLLRLLHARLVAMEPRHLATCLWALAALDVRPSEAWLEAFLDASARRMAPALAPAGGSPFGPQALSTMLGALARLRYRPPYPWIARFLEVCRKELASFDPQSTTTLAWGLARLSFRPPGKWAAAFAAASRRQLRAMPPLGLSLLLWSVARWRITMPMPWVRSALAASAEHLRAGAAGWERTAGALEDAAAAVTTGAAPAPAPPPPPMRPELLAQLVMAAPQLLARDPKPAATPGWWLAAADAATTAALRHSSAAGGAGAPGALDVWTLGLLLCGWAALRSPLSEGSLAAALAYIEDAAAAAAVGTAGARGQSDCQRPGPQHISLALWSCAVAGWAPPAETLERLLALHSRLVLTESESAGREAVAGKRGAKAEAEAVAAAAAADADAQVTKEHEGQQLLLLQQRRRLLLVAQQMVAREAELGMLVWSLPRCGAAAPPDWLPGVLSLVGARMEQDAAAAAATAATATATDVATEEPARGMQPKPQPTVSAAAAAPAMTASGSSGGLTLLTLATLCRACLAWRLHPGERWLSAASGALESGVLQSQIRNLRRRAKLEREVRYLLEQLRAGANGGDEASDRSGGGQRSAWAVAEAAGNAVLTNAMAAMAAGGAAAWMQGLVW